MPRLEYFDTLIERIMLWILGWRARFLFAGAKISFPRSVFSSIPIHLLSLLKVPTLVIDVIHRIFTHFFLEV